MTCLANLGPWGPKLIKPSLVLSGFLLALMRLALPRAPPQTDHWLMRKDAKPGHREAANDDRSLSIAAGAAVVMSRGRGFGVWPIAVWSNNTGSVPLWRSSHSQGGMSLSAVDAKKLSLN
ncbi:unnamed protein product [Lota lota]